MILAALLFFIFGTIVGSFLNVVILRYNSGRSIVSGRSSCPHCRHELGLFELVPVISFLVLGGRCKKCGSKISWQYPMVELLTGILFAAIYFKDICQVLAKSCQLSIFLIPNSLFLILDLIVFAILIVILVYDMRHKIIPDGLVYAFTALSLVKMFLMAPPGVLGGAFSYLNLLAGPLFFIPFFLLWYFSGGRWMGFGDAKLALGIGWFLGFVGGLSAIILGFWSGALIGVILLIVEKRKVTMKSEIPFAPFLILGLTLVYFFNWDLTGLHLILQ